jgi:replicative DNA helicase
MPMGLNWTDLSEVTAGYLLTRKISASAVKPECLVEPYPALVEMLKSRKVADEAELIEKIGLQAYSAAIMAAERETVGADQIIVLLEKAYSRAEAASQLERELRRLKLGEDIDLSKVTSILDSMKASETRIVRMDQIVADETPLVLCGWEPIDTFIGGIPEIGVTVIAGPPSGGKTSLAAKLLAKWVKTHKKPAFYFSLELTNEQIVNRAIQVESLSAKEKKLIYFCDKVDGIDDLCSVISKLKDVSLVIIDFAELAIEGEASEQIVSSMYRKLLWTAKNLSIPIIVLSQMNRKYDGAVPVMTMVKWAGEQLARLVLLIYNTDSVLVSPADAEVLPPLPGMIYLVVGKTTFGKKASGKGAIRIPFKDTQGWGDKADKWVVIGSPKAAKKEPSYGR